MKATLQLALEALELCNGAETVDGVVIYTDKEIAAIKEALAQPEQIFGFDVVIDETMPPNTFKLAQPEQEPVAFGIKGGLAHETKVKND